MKPRILYFIVRPLATTVIAALLLLPLRAHAGPPFVTDDPDPVDVGKWEINTFSQGVHVSEGTVGTLPSIEVNRGVLPDLELRVLASLAYAKQGGDAADFGISDIEIGSKYRLLDEDDTFAAFRAAISPYGTLSTGDSDRSLGIGHSRIFFPLWIGWDFDRWSTYGGGGYALNRGGSEEDYWFCGWVLQRSLTDQLAAGVEFFHQTPSGTLQSHVTGFNVGLLYDFDANHHLLFSSGRGLQNAAETNRFSYYLGYQLTF